MAQKEEQERREQEVAELVEQLKASGLFKPTLPQYDPATLEPPTNEVKSYQQVVSASDCCLSFKFMSLIEAFPGRHDGRWSA